MQVESTHIHFQGIKVEVENGLFTFEDDDLIGFSQGYFVIVIHVVMNGISFPDQRKF